MQDPKTQRAFRRARSPSTILFSFAVAVLGGVYGIWAVGQMDPERAPRPEEAFDRPIARLVGLFQPERDRIAKLETQTELERKLAVELDETVDLLARGVVFVFRLLIASACLTMGLTLAAVGITARQFGGIHHERESDLEIAQAGRRVGPMEGEAPDEPFD